MALVHLRHERTGQDYRVPKSMVLAARKAGFHPVNEVPDAPTEEGPDGLADHNVAVEPVETEEDFEHMTNDQLRDILADQGKPTSGNKDELVARLREDA